MKHFLFLALILILLFSGCSQPPEPEPTELPNDFEITYTSHAMHLDWGGFEFETSASGNASLINTMGLAMEARKDFSVTKEELLEVYKVIVANNFFSLNESYYDPSIMDGGEEVISITAHGNSKRVSVVNFYQPQFDAVGAKISELITKKLGLNAFDMKSFCSEKKIECEERPLFECGDAECAISDDACEEWSEYCAWDSSEDPTHPLELTPEYCNKLQNREECIEHCSDDLCSQELCDTLMFEASECTECGPGCCEKCTNLSSCSLTFCEVAWVLPYGGAWEFGGCQNINLCMSFEETCASLSNNYEGYAVAVAVEDDSETAKLYQEISELLEQAYADECN
ncbi:MAG: hypothetical protein CL944_01390 [Candidatus Diapherotrites archaeon]|uniref:Uncharacterized protein n=1 Tax=Candidatus Iainarchaeum sp. TaxID=3101447 RepID=A0A2D6LPJ5_9ARCH|nr:hypothetical protein [Candidatus Diapherotrites archaeon]|tara:strand:+ start:2250 stop:3275 length:1026 start_codon:yes stop_codon:yes gene_type:complete